MALGTMGGGGGDVFGSIADTLGQVAKVGADLYLGITQQKAAKKAAKAASGVGLMYGGPNMFMGQGGYGFPTAAYSLPATPPGSTSPMTDVLSYLGLGAQGAGSAANPCSLFTAVNPNAPRFRAISLVSQMAPNGKLHFWRHVGTPILYSGDVSHCRRVNKLLGRARRGGRARTKR